MKASSPKDLTLMFSIECLTRMRGTERVLVLGPGDGKRSLLMAQRASHVIAVDRVAPPAGLPQNVEWIQADIEDWLETLGPADTFDGILAFYVLPHLPRTLTLELLLPQLRERLRPGGHIALRTFTRQSEPPMPFDPTLFTATELIERLGRLEILQAFQYNGPQLCPNERIVRHYWELSILARRTT